MRNLFLGLIISAGCYAQGKNDSNCAQQHKNESDRVKMIRLYGCFGTPYILTENKKDCARLWYEQGVRLGWTLELMPGCIATVTYNLK